MMLQYIKLCIKNFIMKNSITYSNYVRHSLHLVSRSADTVMLSTLVLSGFAAMLLGRHEGLLAFAVLGAFSIALPGVMGFWLGRGTTFSWVALTLSNAAMVAFHIQISRGTVEYHFGVFVLLGLLLVYRDWRPIVLGAAFFAVHHVLFDRLQALGWGVYCTTTPDFGNVVLHAAYVVLQTGIEIFLALVLRRAAIEQAELNSVVAAIDQGGSLHLDVSGLHVASPAARNLQAAMGKIANALREVGAAAGHVELAADEIAVGSHDLSRRTESQVSSLQQTAASMEMLTQSVRATADSADTAAQYAGEASRTASGGGSAVHKVVETMQNMAQSSSDIAEITGVIDGIAFQTNILALNAAIEAARAGEHGKGFAVVAKEVRNLAARSADAAKQIRTLVEENLSKVNAGRKQVNDAGSGMASVVEGALKVSDVVQGIATGTRQQSTGISDISRSITQLDSFTQQNAALVEQSAAAAQSLHAQAVKLNEVVRRFVLGDMARSALVRLG